MGIPGVNLLGRQLYLRENDAVGLNEAIGAYQKAIALDPDYAAAYAGLAMAKAFRACRLVAGSRSCIRCDRESRCRCGGSPPRA